MQEFFTPKKLSLFVDWIYLIGFAFAQMWGPFIYTLIPIIPVSLLEWAVYPFAGFLNLPIIPFVEWYTNSLNWGKTPIF
jgi:hypothetical protein